MHPRLVMFDLDDTLAESKSRIDPTMAAALSDLLDVVDVCIISGGAFEQFTTQVLGHLPDDARRDGLHVMPTCGTRYHRWDGSEWAQVYAEDLTPEQVAQTMSVLEEGSRELGLWAEDTWGPALEDRGSQVTYSALGQSAPVDAKAAWDPDGSKKERLRAWAQPRLPELEVRSGGSTSVDVTRKGIDKSFGVARLSERLGIGLDEMLFIGDRLDPGGNDRPVMDMGVRSIPVEGWEDTLVQVRELVSDLSSD